MKTTTIMVALYARVSTRRQEQEATIESQIAQLLAYAREQGYHIPDEFQFIDQAVSGDLLARPGLDRLRDAAIAGKIQVLLCLNPSRFARNLGIQQLVLKELKQHGVKVIFLNQPTLGDSPPDQLLLNIQGAFAEYERAVISDRMRRGRLYKLKQGQSVPWPAPYGYDYQATTDTQQCAWLVNEAEATIVEQIFEWYTEGNLSISGLVRHLNAQNIPSPAGKRWGSSTVGRLLRQPAYKGIAYYNRTQADYRGIGLPRHQGRGCLQFPRYKSRPAEEWICVPVPAIVSETVWLVAQEQLKMNSQLSKRNNHKHAYLLKSLLVCKVCGRTLQGRAQKDVTHYRCPGGGKHRSPGVPKHTCTVRGDVAEKLIWDALADLLRNPDRIQDAWQAHQAERTATPNQVSRQKKRKKHLQKQRQRLLDAYQASVLSLEELTERQNPLVLELQKLENQLATTESTIQTKIDLDHFTQMIEQALAATDVQTKQEVIRLLIERIVISDETLTVEHVVPTVNHSQLRPTFRET